MANWLIATVIQRHADARPVPGILYVQAVRLPRVAASLVDEESA